MNDSPDLPGSHPGPAADLVEGRLRDGRQHRLQRQREPRRGARDRPRRAGARRRLRQRQRRDRRGAAHLGRRGRRRLRPRAARARPRARRRRAARRRVRRGRRPGPALRGRRASTSRCRSSARCSPPTSRRPPPSCCAWSNPAAGSGWPTGPRTAPSARCSRRSPSTRRRRPGVDSPLLWGTEERLRELFGDGISDLRVERRISRQPFRSADHYIEFFRTYFGPTQMAYERVGPRASRR